MLHVAPERKENVGGELLLTPARLITFDTRGEYRTSDEEEIRLIRRAIQRKKDRYGEVDVFEVTQDDLLNVVAAEEALKLARERLAGKTKRGSITSKTLSGELSGPDEEPEPTPVEKAEAEMTSECEFCGKTFENDPKGRRLKAHQRIKHKPAEGEDETED